MKKTLSLILAMALAMGTAVSVCAEGTAETFCDLSGDGKTNVTDLSLAAAHIKGYKKMNEQQLVIADLNGDGRFNVTDLSKLADNVKGGSRKMGDIISDIDGFIKEKGLHAVVYEGEDVESGIPVVTVQVDSTFDVPLSERDKSDMEVIESIKDFAEKQGYDADSIQFIIAA